MMKRILSFFLGAALIVTLAVPVSADELYNPWTDLMDLTTVNGSGTNYFAFNNSTTINIDAGYESVVGYIDMVWFCGYGAPDSIYLWRNNSPNARLPLTIKRIGTSNFYRVYGNVSSYTMRNFKFDITSNTAYNGTGSYRSYEIRSCRIAGSIGTYNVGMSYMVSPDPSERWSKNVCFDPIVDMEYGIAIPYVFEIHPTDWTLYDYVDILVSTQSATIDSVVVEHNGRAIPFTTTDHGTSYAGGTFTSDYDGATFGDSYMMLHIDLTTIQHSSSITPKILITGFYNNGIWASIGWDSAIGYVRDAERGGVLHWFNQAKEFLTGLFGVGEGQDSLNDLGESSDSISQSASDIHNFEQSQQAVLDNNFAAIQNTITFTNFAAALVFVQKYANLTVSGISKYMVVFTLPLFLGLFFFLCSRVPGITRWKPRPPQKKGGNSP